MKQMIKKDNIYIFLKKYTNFRNIISKQFLFQFDNRPGLSRRDVIHESIQVANIADLVRYLPKNFVFLKTFCQKWTVSEAFCVAVLKDIAYSNLVMLLL